MPKSSVKIVFAEPQLIPTSSALSQMVKRRSSMFNVRTFVNDISISARSWSPGTLVTVRRRAANFKAVAPHFTFCLGIPKFLTKLDAVSLLQALSS
jgi:hypothetical protein